MKTIEIMRRLEAIDLTRVAEMVAEGYSYRAIGERFGVSYGWVSDRMKELGIEGGRPWKTRRREYEETKAQERWRLALP